MKLRQPRTRIKRAKMHQKEFGRIWNEFLSQDEPYVVSVVVDPAGAGTIYVYANRLPSEQLSLEFGEMLYQLRAALDSLVYELAIIDSGQDPPPNPQKLEFPIRTSKASFDHVADKIEPLSDQHRTMIESIQPYDLGDKADGMRLTAETFDLINDLARKDRHRSLHVTASWGANRNPMVEVFSDTCKVEWVKPTADGLLEDDDVVARFQISDWVPETKVEANPNLTIDPMIEELPPPSSDEDTLNVKVRTMFAVLQVVIEGFENTLD